MKSKFRSGILAFGLVFPLLGILAVFGVVLSKNSGLEREYADKQSQYTRNQQVKMAAMAIQTKLHQYDGKSDQWKSLVAKSDVSALNETLKKISGSFTDTRTFNRTEFKFDNNDSGIGAASEQPSFSFDLTVNGTYRSIQTGLLALESEMPNLSLNSMKLTPRPNDQLLEAQLSYSAWSR